MRSAKRRAKFGKRGRGGRSGGGGGRRGGGRKPKKRTRYGSSESSEEDSSSGEEWGKSRYKKKGGGGGGRGRKRKAADSDEDDSDSDYKPQKKRGPGGGGGGGGFSKPMKLSEELADIVGKDQATRGEVVKQMWAYIKENNLQDPKNKQYAKSDEKLMKVIGQKRFRCFSMAKHLGEHMTKV